MTSMALNHLHPDVPFGKQRNGLVSAFEPEVCRAPGFLSQGDLVTEGGAETIGSPPSKQLELHLYGLSFRLDF